MSLASAVQAGLHGLNAGAEGAAGDRPTCTAVLTSFNKCEDVRKNVAALLSQTEPFQEIICVDNHSGDGTIEMVRQEFPDITFIVMPDSSFGACETFNLGFRKAATDYVAILDDDVVLGPTWLADMLDKAAREPPTTAVISSKVVEPEMPQWFKDHPEVNRERYMSTFRGCASLARRDVLERCGYYAEDFFIYGNERDLTARVLKAGYRVLQYPKVVVDHGTPFGMKRGARSLFYHTRNLWWTLFKHYSLADSLGFVVRQFTGKLTRRREGARSDAVGTIGFFETIKETPGGLWVVVKATLAALLGLPGCLKVRRVCRAADWSLPDH